MERREEARERERKESFFCPPPVFIPPLPPSRRVIKNLSDLFICTQSSRALERNKLKKSREKEQPQRRRRRRKQEKNEHHHAEADTGATAESLSGDDSCGHLGGALLAEAGSGALPQGCGSSESFGISPCWSVKEGREKREGERERREEGREKGQ